MIRTIASALAAFALLSFAAKADEAPAADAKKDAKAEKKHGKKHSKKADKKADEAKPAEAAPAK